MDTNRKHTATPWRVGSDTFGGVVSIWGESREVARQMAPEDAERAVRAVNAHGALVNALERVLGCMNAAPISSANRPDVAEQIDAALRLARGEG